MIKSTQNNNKLWTVVIPTMWRPKTIVKLLEALNSSEEIGEIIIIDNAQFKRNVPLEFNKIVHLIQSENIYVNPAWNLGVKQAKYPNICLCNDDVVIKNEVFFWLNKYNLEKTIIGCHFENFISGVKQIEISIHNGHCIGDGWGCVLFFEKKYFKSIDETLKIYCGDDWLVDKFKFNKSLKFDLEFEMSVTSSDLRLNDIARKDILFLGNLLDKFRLRRIKMLHLLNLNKYSFLQRLVYNFFTFRYDR